MLNSTNTNETMLDKTKPKTIVLWDISTCPVPDGYDARMVAQSIEWAVKKAVPSGPLTITAYGNLKQTSKRTPDVLRAISSTGIHLTHFAIDYHYYQELLVWTRANPPPANIMLITGNLEQVKLKSYALSLMENRKYTVLQTYPQTASHLVDSEYTSSTMSLKLSRKCIWEMLLKDAIDSGETSRRALEEKLCVTGGSPCRFFCNLCKFTGQSCEDFTTHLQGRDHLVLEVDLVSGPPPKRKLVKPIFTISKYLNKQKKSLKCRIEEDRMSL